MNTTNERLISKAEDAISDLFGDRSVAASETRTNLQELIGFISTMLDTLPE